LSPAYQYFAEKDSAIYVSQYGLSYKY